MCDDWEDWENADFTIPEFKPPNPEQLKILENRKLIEEADLQNAKDLFTDNDEEVDLTIRELKKSESQKLNKNISNTNIHVDVKPKREKIVNNQKANEEKQKEQSKILKEQKARKARERELFGEADDDEYAEYEDMYH